ncbi:MAG: alpha/beta hydrolase [Microthrixaceae bacterium]
MPTATELTTDDGVALAAELEVPADPVAAAVLLHPHPLMGGDMRTPVPDHLFRALPDHGVAVLRFDFRGAGRSGGTHAGGTAEAGDVRAAIDALAAAAPGLPIWLVGWSFGADVSTQVTDPRVAGWVLVAPPLSSVPSDAMAAATDPRPTLLLVPRHDQFLDPDAAAGRTAGWSATTVQVVPGVDHFLAGRLGTVTDAVLSALLGGAARQDLWS